MDTRDAGVPRVRPVRRAGRDGRLDARRVPRSADQVHRDARQLGAHGRAARARLDPPRADAAAQARAHREDPGRGRSRAADLPRRRGPRQAAERLPRRPRLGQVEVPQRLPLPDEDLGRRRRDRVARRRGRDRLAEGAAQVLVRAVRADHEEDLLGGVVPHPPRPRRHPRAGHRHGGAVRARAGGARPLVGAAHAVPREPDPGGGGPDVRVADQEPGRTRRRASSSSTATCRRSASSGSTIPDPALRKDEETGTWLYTEPDWEKLRAVVTGHGPASEERLAFRRLSREDVAWVEQVVLAEAA